MIFRRRQKLLLAIVTLSLALSTTIMPDSFAAQNPMFKSKIDLNAPVSFDQTKKMIPGEMAEDEIGLRKLLRQLGRIAGINMILDDSVQGAVTVSFEGISVAQALEYLRNISGLYYVPKGDNILLVTTKETAAEKGLNKSVSKMIPIKYVNAKLVEVLLNNTVYSAELSSADPEKKATAEFRTNSIILVGSDNDIRLAEEMIDRVDVPRESKTFKINHAAPVEVAQLLTATIFNDGISPFNGSGNAEQGDLPSSPSSVSVNVETYEEGSGSEEVQGASGDSGGGESQTFTLRSKQLATKNIKISPDGPMIIPDTRTSTLTIMGTVEQIALAEAVIPTLDQKLPQVAIETSLIELFEDGIRRARMIYGTSDGQFAFGFNNQSIPKSPTAGAPNAAYRSATTRERDLVRNGQVVPDRFVNQGLLNNIVGIPTATNPGQEGFAFNWTTIPIERSTQVIGQLDSIVGQGKGKILANPTVIAMHNTEAIVSITEEVIRSTSVTRDQTGFTQTQVEIGEVGIVLNILPKITGDGYVIMRIRPSVSTIADIIQFGDSTVTLLDRRDLAVQEVRVANGQTLALGGLIQERDISTGARVPGLGSIPIIGALFRTSLKDKSRSELITLVTPRIMDDASPLSPARISSLMRKPEFQDMINQTNSKLNHK